MMEIKNADTVSFSLQTLFCFVQMFMDIFYNNKKGVQYEVSFKWNLYLPERKLYKNTHNQSNCIT